MGGMARLLGTLHGVVGAPVDDVAAVVLDAPASGGGVTVEVDRAARTVARLGVRAYPVSAL
jgi:hypothetical protein